MLAIFHFFYNFHISYFLCEDEYAVRIFWYLPEVTALHFLYEERHIVYVFKFLL